MGEGGDDELEQQLPGAGAGFGAPDFDDDDDVGGAVGGGFDAFKDAEGQDGGDASVTKNYIHVRVQQRNGRKSLTTIQGIDPAVSYKKVLKAFKKVFCCNGTVVEDPELGNVIQLQGDQRKNVLQFLTEEGIAKKEVIKLHGF